MATKNLLAFLAIALFVALSLPAVSAFGDITAVEVNGVNALSSGVEMANFAGDTIPVRIVFRATEDAEDVRAKVWISGERENAFVSERFDVLSGGFYTRVISLEVPSDLGTDLNEERNLEIVVENQEELADSATVDLRIQRESYKLEILNVNFEPTVNAGDILAVDVVLKNRGSHFAEDTFVKMVIPDLSLQTTSYFGDLSAVDQSDPDKEDAVERRIFLRIPSNVKPGLYSFEIEASNDDSIVRQERRVLVSAGAEETMVVSPLTSKTISLGEETTYSVTVVNSGDTVKVYELSLNAPQGIDLYVSEPVVVVPAGLSRTVELTAIGTEAGTHSFSVDIISDGQNIGSKAYTAKVQYDGGSRSVVSSGFSADAAVILVVILGIIFVVLLIVLIVLLTRKPETTEEINENYY